MPPVRTFAIGRTAAMVPMRFRSSGSGSSRSPVMSERKSRRSCASARLTASIDSARVIARGCRVRGKTTVSRRASAGSSLGYVRASDAITGHVRIYDLAMALDERDFFNNRNEVRNDRLTCPRCKRANDYQMRWVVRTRKDRIPPGADERDRALFAKLRDYMIRVDDAVTCKTCGKKFDIPSQHSLVFLQKEDS